MKRLFHEDFGLWPRKNPPGLMQSLIRRRCGFESLACRCHSRYPGHPFPRALVRLLHLHCFLQSRPPSSRARRPAHRDGRSSLQFRCRFTALVPLFEPRRPGRLLGGCCLAWIPELLLLGVDCPSAGVAGDQVFASGSEWRCVACSHRGHHLLDRGAHRCVRAHQRPHHSHSARSDADSQLARVVARPQSSF